MTAPRLPERWTMEAMGRPDRKLEISKNEGDLKLYISNYVAPNGAPRWTAELTYENDKDSFGVHCVTDSREKAIETVERMAVMCEIARPREGKKE